MNSLGISNKLASFFKSRIIRYIFSGGTAAAVNLIITWALERMGVYYLIVVSVAFVAALITSFLLQKYFTFENSVKQGIRSQFAVFTGIGIVNLIINDFIVYLQIRVLFIGSLVIAEAVASILISLYNFFIYRYLFRTP
jgi:putative flippase GtrA